MILIKETKLTLERSAVSVRVIYLRGGLTLAISRAAISCTGGMSIKILDNSASLHSTVCSDLSLVEFKISHFNAATIPLYQR